MYVILASIKYHAMLLTREFIITVLVNEFDNANNNNNVMCISDLVRSSALIKLPY